MSEQLRLTDSNLPDYLRNLGLVGEGDLVAVEKAGDGNINWVRRARLRDGRSWIVKQARPALERFPQYQVSTERIVFEARYYAVARPLDPVGVCPAIHHFDEGERVLVLEDLGDAERLDALLARGGDGRAPARALARFLAAVHGATAGDASLLDRFDGDAMRHLHGDHIFALPFAPDAEAEFPLAPAVAERARPLRARAFRELAAAAYARYREPRGALVHGDVQAGNVLLPPQGAKLLDAEIAHVGDPAFDLGTLVAHLLLAAVAAGRAQAALPAVQEAWDTYRADRRRAGPAGGRERSAQGVAAAEERERSAQGAAAAEGRERSAQDAAAAGDAGAAAEVRFSAVARYAGLELLRRTVGAARVPAVEDETAAIRVIDAGERWVRTPPDDPAGLLPA